MRFKRSWLLVFFLLSFFTLIGCAAQTSSYGRVRVVFELEGGVYQNCELPIVHRYDFKEGSYNLISEPTTLSKKEVTRSGYTLQGWYKEKTVHADESVSYAGKWNFGTDKVTDEGVTLYACWKKDVRYSYNVCYYDDENVLRTLGSYDVNEGEGFDDYLRYANKRLGYTAIAFRDEEGDLWDESYKHPGGETDLAVNVYVEYIPGEYAVVRTASDLKANKSKNIYLANDIDFRGGDFGGFGGYKGIFLGNGYKISNFHLTYSASKDSLIDDEELDEEGNLLCISLFGNLSGATIRDVTFENVTLDVKTTLQTTKKIFVAPLCIKMSDSTVSNVRFTGTFTNSRLPAGFDPANLVVVTDRAFYFQAPGDTSRIVGYTSEIADFIGS